MGWVGRIVRILAWVGEWIEVGKCGSIGGTDNLSSGTVEVCFGVREQIYPYLKEALGSENYLAVPC